MDSYNLGYTFFTQGVNSLKNNTVTSFLWHSKHLFEWGHPLADLPVYGGYRPLLLLVTLILLALIYLCYLKACRPANFPPGPKPYPFIGNLPISINNLTFHQTLHQLAAKYGGIVGLQMSWYPVVVVSDLEILQQMLVKQGDVFNDRPRDLPYFKMLFKGQGLILQNGEPWKKLRKLAMSSLHEFGLGRDSLEASIQQEASLLLAEVDKQQTNTIKVHTLFHKAVSNIICSALFGKRFDYEDKDYGSLVAALDFMFLTGGFQNPYLFLPLFTFITIPLTQPIVFESIQQLKVLRKFIRNQIQEHRSSFQSSEARDFVDLYLQAEKQEEKSEVFTEGNMFQVILDLFMAGTETISQTMEWAFLFLIKNPHVQDRCRQEIFSVIGENRVPCIRDRSNMPYTEATIYEIQRLSVSLGVLHNTNKTVELCGYTIPKDTVVLTNFHSIHQDPRYWPEPQEFRPERFLNEDNTHRRPPAWLTFGLGKRACPGENLVRQELFLFLTSLLQRYEFTSPTDIDSLPGHDQAKLGITLEAPDYELIATKL